MSGIADELRAMAESVGFEVPQAATLMMEAADTIWELRCKCADLMSEREEYVWTREFMDRMAKHCGTKDCPSLVSYVEGLEDENAKLRELVRDMNECLEHCKLVCKHCKFQGVDCQWFKFIERMCELGIEVGA